MMQHKLIKLQNGIRVVGIPSEKPFHTEVAVNILLGNMHESLKELHMTHFAEHLLANLAPDIRQMLSKQGAYFNAFTNDYCTKFVISGPDKYVDYYLDVLSNVISNFKINNQCDIENERQAVIQELQQKMDTNSIYVFDAKMNKYMYPDDSRNDYALIIRKLKSYTSADMVEYIRTHIISKNIVVAISHKRTDMHKVLRLAKKYFSRVKTSHIYHIIFKPVIHKKRGAKVLYIKNMNKNTSNAIIRMVADKPLNYGSIRYYSMLCLGHILFNNLSGIVHNELRKQLGLIYGISMNIQADVTNYIRTGYVIETNTEETNVAKVLATIINIIETCKITDEQVNTAKTNMLLMQNNVTPGDHYIHRLLHGAPTTDNKQQHIINIHKKHVIKVLKEIQADLKKNLLIFYYTRTNQNRQIRGLLKDCQYLVL